MWLYIIGAFVLGLGGIIYQSGPGYEEITDHPYVNQCFVVPNVIHLSIDEDVQRKSDGVDYQSYVVNEAVGQKGVRRRLWYRPTGGHATDFVVVPAATKVKITNVIKYDSRLNNSHTKYILFKTFGTGEPIKFIYIEYDYLTPDNPPVNDLFKSISCEKQ